MLRRRNLLVALCCAASLLCIAGAPRTLRHLAGWFKIDVSPGPYLSQSRIAVAITGIFGPFKISALGGGTVRGSTYRAPNVRAPQRATLVAAAHGARAVATLRIVPPPATDRPLLAVASYDDGIALYDARTMHFFGYVAIGGPPGDVAFTPNGDLVAPDTDGNALTSVARSPWHVRQITGVSTGNEVRVSRSGAIFVSDRDTGTLTRILPDGTVRRIATGNTPEGLAIDERRGIIYVGNVNSSSVAVVSMKSLRVLRRFKSVPRTFGIALNASGKFLYAVANLSPTMNAGGGYAAIIDVTAKHPRVIARSGPMPFPIGAAFDARHDRLFVTDEAENEVYVFDGRTLRPRHAPLRTCDTPWRPSVMHGLLYVPCAQSNQVDVFALRTLRRIRGSPFKTGGFPLAVARWP